MDKIGNLELNIMSCLLINPELMDKIELEDKYFVKHQRLWLFMKSFYKKFKTFDPQLMYSVCKDKWHIVEYMVRLVEIDPAISNFELYQKQLVEEYNQSKKDRWIINKVYQLTNDLYVGNVKIETFREDVENIFNNANKIFKEN